AAPDADKQERGLEAQTDSQLTDIGIPCFDPPPAVAESASQEDDRQNGPHEQAHARHPGLEPATARAGAAAAAPVDEAAAQDDVNVSAAPLSSPAPTASVSPAAPARQRSRTAPAAPGGGGDRGRLMMILLASYASAVTIAAL